MECEVLKDEFMKNELIKTPGHIKEFQNKQNLEHLSRKVELIKSELLEEMTSCGILPIVAEKILDGKEVINCPKCSTPNMYRYYDTFEDGFGFNKILEIYKCANCKEVNFKL